MLDLAVWRGPRLIYPLSARLHIRYAEVQQGYDGTQSVAGSSSKHVYVTRPDPRDRKGVAGLTPIKSTKLTADSVVHTIPPGFEFNELKIPKYGILDFNFGSYNSTPHAGLENTHPDSYVNSEVHMLYGLPHVRDVLMNHLCTMPTCLACELGFLFHMLEQAEKVDARFR